MILTYFNIFQVLLLTKILTKSVNCGTIEPQYIINVNVLFINEPGNYLATKAVDSVYRYLKDNPYYRLTLHIDHVDVNTTVTAESFLDLICNKYNKSIENNHPPHVVFDTTKWGITSETVKLFTRTMGLPTVSASFGQAGDLKEWRYLRENEEKYLLQVMSPIDIIPHVLRTLINDMIIRDAAILYDETFIMKHKYKSLVKQIKTRHIIIPLAKSEQARIDQIHRIRNLNINNFFILGSKETIGDVLALVKPEFFEHSFAWYAITPYEGDIPRKLEYAKFMLIQPTPRIYHSTRLYSLRRKYKLINEPQVVLFFYFDLVLRTVLAVKEILQSGVWNANMKYIYCNDYQYNNTPERNIDFMTYFQQVTEPTNYGNFVLSDNWKNPFNGYQYGEFQMDAKIIHIYKDENIDKDKDEDDDIFQIYGGEEEDKFTTKYSSEIYGYFLTGLYAVLSVKNAEKFKSFTPDTVYRILTVVQPPFIIKDNSEPKGYKGFCIDLINKIAKSVGFDYTIKEVEDGKFGQMNDKGEWNGIVRKLIDKDADIGLGSMSVMTEREMVVDFTVPYYDLVGITIMMHKPNSTSLNSLFKFFTVLEVNVWLCIVASYFFTSFLLWAFDRWSPFSYKNNSVNYNIEEETPREFTLKECLWFSITSLTSQGGGEVPKNISGYLVAAVWWTFGFIIIAAYTANLSAFLTISGEYTSMESLDDLTEQYKILYAPLNDSMVLNYFERMTNIEQRFYNIWKNVILNDSLSPLKRSKFAVWENPLSVKYTKIWNAIHDAQLPNTLDEAVERVRKSNPASGFAFLGDATDIRYLVTSNCDLKMVGEEFSRKPYAIAVQHGSHLKDQFNNVIINLLNNRDLEKLKEKWWKYVESPTKCAKPSDPSDGISIEDMAGVFIVIFGGIIVAFIILALELCWFKCLRW